MSVELKPCPFCGGKPILHEAGNDYTKSRRVVIKCPSCRAQRADSALRHSMEWLIGVATEHWNRRKQQESSSDE
ncbi:Lar family restriction alleviation protein [Pseudoxanthomonas winnipegensis]|uniref:Lar family restriction alleviation protein n=1 Tax=Pseudoxanthomonas winnipegensis TaxID=2480810 RepID=UPI0013EF2A57